jgi:hypothetical protein
MHQFMQSDNIYVIGCGDFGAYKIGISTSASVRKEQLQSGCPFELSVVYSFNTPYARFVERIWHEKFHKSHLRGEWFDLTKKQVDLIKKETPRYANFEYLVEHYPQHYVSYIENCPRKGHNIPSALDLITDFLPHNWPENPKLCAFWEERRRAWLTFLRNARAGIKQEPFDIKKWSIPPV